MSIHYICIHVFFSFTHWYNLMRLSNLIGDLDLSTYTWHAQLLVNGRSQKFPEHKILPLRLSMFTGVTCCIYSFIVVTRQPSVLNSIPVIGQEVNVNHLAVGGETLRWHRTDLHHSQLVQGCQETGSQDRGRRVH